MYLNDDKQIIISREELLKVGITGFALDKAVFRGTVINAERGEYLLNSLSKDWQGLVERTLCKGEDAFSYLVKRNKVEVLRGMLPLLKDADKELLNNYRIEKVDKENGVVIQTTKLPKEVIEKYMLKCRWLDLLTSYDIVLSKVATLEKFNKSNKTSFENKAQFQNAVVMLANETEKLLPENLRKLDYLIKDYKKEGAKAVISGKYGSNNAQKLGDLQVEYLTWLMSQQSTTGFVHASEIFNRIAADRNWETVTDKTVNNWMNKPEYHTMWYLAKHGWFEWKKIYEHSLTTVPPSFKNALWIYDDTKHNMYYRAILKVAGKDTVVTMAKLQVAVILDAYSGCVLSAVFFEGKPTVSTVQDCMREALKKSKGELPYQILYDGDAAPVNFFKRFDGIHFKAMPYNGQSKLIERHFGNIQQKYYRMYPNHTGQNVTARSSKSIANKELIAKLEKEGSLPTKDKCIEQGKMVFLLANNDNENGKKLSNIEKYKENKYPEGYTPRNLTPEDTISLLWQEHETKNLLPYTNEGLEFTLDKRKYAYIALDKDNLPDQSKIGHKFKVLYDVEQISKAVALFTEDYRFVTMAYEKEVFARAIYDMKEGERSRITEILTARKGQKSKVVQELRANNEELANKFSQEMGTTDFDNIGFNYGKGVLEAVEKAYYEELTGEEESVVEEVFEEVPNNTVNEVVIPTKRRSIFPQVNA
jgi:hypothetical protein